MVANNDNIERIKSVILHFHQCKPSWVEDVPLEEVFTRSGHPKLKKACAWSRGAGPDDRGERFATVLEIPPVESPQPALKVAIAAEARGKK